MTEYLYVENGRVTGLYTEAGYAVVSEATRERLIPCETLPEITPVEGMVGYYTYTEQDGVQVAYEEYVETDPIKLLEAKVDRILELLEP